MLQLRAASKCAIQSQLVNFIHLYLSHCEPIAKVLPYESGGEGFRTVNITLANVQTRDYDHVDDKTRVKINVYLVSTASPAFGHVARNGRCAHSTRSPSSYTEAAAFKVVNSLEPLLPPTFCRIAVFQQFSAERTASVSPCDALYHQP